MAEDAVGGIYEQGGSQEKLPFPSPWPEPNTMDMPKLEEIHLDLPGSKPYDLQTITPCGTALHMPLNSVPVSYHVHRTAGLHQSFIVINCMWPLGWMVLREGAFLSSQGAESTLRTKHELHTKARRLTGRAILRGCPSLGSAQIVGLFPR